MTRQWMCFAAALAAVAGVLAAVASIVAAPGAAGPAVPLLVKIVGCALLGAVGALVVRLAPRRAAAALLVAAGLGAALFSLAPKAPLSTDLYRYAWDGRVQASGVDPYRYSPGDLTLLRLHQPWLFPSVSDCLNMEEPPYCTVINRSGEHTIYPPAAELYFVALDVSGVDHFHDLGLEGAGAVVSLAVLAVMLSLLRAGDGVTPGRGRWFAAFWVFSPLPALEIVADAHVDGLALLLSLLAFVVLRRGHPLGSAALISLAALTKLYPALLLVAVLSRRPRDAARQVAVFAAVFAAGYAPHVAVVGVKVIGYLPGYLREEDYDQGTRYFLLGVLGIRGRFATALVVLILAATVAVVLRRRPSPLTAATWLLGALFLLTTPDQPWYAVSLGAVAVCAGRPEWLAVGIAGYPVYLGRELAGSVAHSGELSYGLAAMLVLTVSLLRWRAVDRRRMRVPLPRMARPGCSPARRVLAATRR